MSIQVEAEHLLSPSAFQGLQVTRNLGWWVGNWRDLIVVNSSLDNCFVHLELATLAYGSWMTALTSFLYRS